MVKEERRKALRREKRLSCFALIILVFCLIFVACVVCLIVLGVVEAACYL
jgi:hypothetical protein